MCVIESVRSIKLSSVEAEWRLAPVAGHQWVMCSNKEPKQAVVVFVFSLKHGGVFQNDVAPSPMNLYPATLVLLVIYFNYEK